MTFGTKYVVVKRDGSIPPWPQFVLGAADPAAPAALRTYATMAKALGVEKSYTDLVMEHAQKFNNWRADQRNVKTNLDSVDVLVVALGLLSGLTSEQRTEVFNHLRARWCIDCGNEECECDGNKVVQDIG